MRPSKTTYSFFAIVGICTFIDCLINKQITWSIFPDLGVICVGASIAIGLELKRSLSNILFYEYIFVCLVTYFWDRITGMHNWDLNYVLPILSVVFIVANLLIFVLSDHHLDLFPKFY